MEGSHEMGVDRALIFGINHVGKEKFKSSSGRHKQIGALTKQNLKGLNKGREGFHSQMNRIDDTTMNTTPNNLFLNQSAYKMQQSS